MGTSKGVKIYQTVILILMIVMALVFTVIYFVANSRVGFEYQGAILVPSQEHGSTVYSGKIQGQSARFTVSEDKMVVFQCGSKTYGPYTAKEDPTAIPKDSEMAQDMIGVELRQGEEILFRGGIWKAGNSNWLINEDGTWAIGTSYVDSSGIRKDENGNPVDTLKPPVTTILELMKGPKLTRKGSWGLWFVGVLLCGMNTLSIFFADALFFWRLRLRVRNAEDVEPSNFELASRCFAWTLVTIMAFALFISGLR